MCVYVLFWGGGARGTKSKAIIWGSSKFDSHTPTYEDWQSRQSRITLDVTEEGEEGLSASESRVGLIRASGKSWVETQPRTLDIAAHRECQDPCTKNHTLRRPASEKMSCPLFGWFILSLTLLRRALEIPRPRLKCNAAASD